MVTDKANGITFVQFSRSHCDRADVIIISHFIQICSEFFFIDVICLRKKMRKYVTIMFLIKKVKAFINVFHYLPLIKKVFLAKNRYRHFFLFILKHKGLLYSRNFHRKFVIPYQISNERI